MATLGKEEEVALDSKDDFGSLFEGMIVIDQFQSSSSNDLPTHTNPTEKTVDKDDADPQSQQSQSQPLDENLFSDLILVHQPELSRFESALSPSTTAPEVELPSSLSRQIPRKKKRGVRIGYARELSYSYSSDSISPTAFTEIPQKDTLVLSGVTAVKDYEANPDTDMTDPTTDFPAKLAPLDVQLASSSEFKTSPSGISVEDPRSHLHSDSPSVLADTFECTQTESPRSNEYAEGDNTDSSKLPRENGILLREEEAADEKVESHEVQNIGLSVEEELQSIRNRISEKLNRIREAAVSIANQKKESAKRRREAADRVNLASSKYKQLEKELEESCEAEDFERAEKVSECLASAETEKEGFLNELREGEAECDSIDLKLQEVLEMQIAAEEEAASLLKQFAEDAECQVDGLLANADELSEKETKEWLNSTEALEAKKMELDIESQLVKEAQSSLNDFIDQSISADRQEKEILLQKRALLNEELEQLLLLVKLKEAEIAENHHNLNIIEKKITDAVSGFQQAQSTIKEKSNYLMSALSELESEAEALCMKKKEVDDLLSLEQEKRLRLMELATISCNESEEWQELAVLRRNLASTVLKAREHKLELAKSEEKISEVVQTLRLQVSSARTSLQELASKRASAQQEIVSSKNRISFIDKRGPDLEAEKKVAAAARNFKEAGRIAAEAKALSIERETICSRMDQVTLELAKVESAIEDTINELQKSEELILSKEQEAALANCERLFLVAAAARAEGSAALEISDLEEAAIFQTEAEAAESEANKLQETYGFQVQETRKTAKKFVSMALIANLTKAELVGMVDSHID